jgi:hypothetical protein
MRPAVPEGDYFLSSLMLAVTISKNIKGIHCSTDIITA